MRYHRLLELLEAGEGLHVEFKRKGTSPEKIAREIIAFANTAGGTLIFGIDDDTTIVGVVSEKEEAEFIELAAHEWCEPPVNYVLSIFNLDNRDVICVEIPESKDKPHFLIEGEERTAFIRVGENSVQASKEMVKIMEHRSGKTGPVRIVIGEAEKRLFRYFEENERITVKEYAHLINVSDRRASRLLVRLVRAGALAIHTNEKTDYFTLLREPSDTEGLHHP